MRIPFSDYEIILKVPVRPVAPQVNPCEVPPSDAIRALEEFLADHLEILGTPMSMNTIREFREVKDATGYPISVSYLGETLCELEDGNSSRVFFEADREMPEIRRSVNKAIADFVEHKRKAIALNDVGVHFKVLNKDKFMLRLSIHDTQAISMKRLRNYLITRLTERDCVFEDFNETVYVIQSSASFKVAPDEATNDYTTAMADYLIEKHPTRLFSLPSIGIHGDKWAIHINFLKRKVPELDVTLETYA